MNTAIKVEGEDITPEIKRAKEKMYGFAKEVLSGQWKGYTGKSIDSIVNIGIGGSDLGPAMVTEALEYYGNHLTPYFVSNVEGDHHKEILKKSTLKPHFFSLFPRHLLPKKLCPMPTAYGNGFSVRHQNRPLASILSLYLPT